MGVEKIGPNQEPKDPYMIHSSHHTQKGNLHSSKAGSNAPSGVSIQGQSCYVDMGKFYGTDVWNCIDWSQTPGRINAQELQQGFFGKFFDQLKNEHVTKIDLSFAQMADIQNLCNDSYGSSSFHLHHQPPYRSSDSFGPVFHAQDSSGAFTKPPYGVFDFTQSPPQQIAPNFLSYMVQYAHQQNPPIKVDLSIGGADAGGADWKLPYDPITSAKSLSDFMNNMGLDSVDFDIENHDIFQQNTSDDLSTFFKQLHSNLSLQGKESTVTLMGGALSDGAYDPVTKGFSGKFDSINLMLYSNSQYYLNAKENTQWLGVEAWLDETHIDPSKLHIGFYDAIHYETPGASADGAKYKIKPGSSRGEAAAQIYQQLCHQLHQDGKLQPGQSLGDPFFWIDTPGDPNSAQVMQDFYNTLAGIPKTPWG